MPIAEIDNGSTVEYDQADTLSLRMVTNSSGTVIEQRGDYPYGEIRPVVAGTNPDPS